MRRAGLGTYVDADSPVHRLDPRVKIGLGAVFAVALFLLDSVTGLAVFSALLIVAVAAARVPLSSALRGVRAVVILLAITIAIRTLTPGADAPLVRLGPVGLYASGLAAGVFFAVRIIILVVGTSLVTLTTTPVALTDALERLMRPAERLGFPAHDVAMMLSIALRFIPVTTDVADRVLTAQKVRGARFDRGGPVRRARAWIPVLVPLFVDLFRRADRLANAMEARCYRGGRGRTRLRELSMRPADWIALAGGTVSFLTAVVATRGFTWPL